MKKTLVYLGFATLALAGCSSEEPADTTAAPTVSASTEAMSSPDAQVTSSPAAQVTTAPETQTPARPAACPVDAGTLAKAFQANAEIAGSIILGKGFKDVSCSEGWATAVTQPDGVDPAVVVFKFDAAKKSWVAVMGGTDGVCVANVPASVRPNLKNC